MKKLSSNEIRQLWLSFFASKGHKVVEGANLVPINDETLLWINSGVAALKQYFDGTKVSSDRRLVNIQKSIRTNDIENVGLTNRHHTFFEMLGNFSLGDYFREEAIKWGFEFLTSEKYLGLPLEKLYFTHHPTDLETKKIWEKCGVPTDHIIANESNFWEIGEGPCGPNTEIFFDLGEELDPLKRGVSVLENDVDNDRFLEIWNIVFSQYNAKTGQKRSEYQELPSKNIDTGAGLERIASVLQGAESNFETDLFLPLITEISNFTNTKYEDHKITYRVISDHIRTTTFALSDGASFSNEGRGYVLRRVLRRAVRYMKKLGINEAFLYRLVPVVITIMDNFYPNLKAKEAHVTKLIKAEEERFLQTLQHGEELVRSALETSAKIDGDVAFKLYDTFGFPLEITLEIAKEQNGEVDVEGFNERLEEQRERARNARKDAVQMGNQSADLLSFTALSRFDENIDVVKEAKVLGLFKEGVASDEGQDVISAIFDLTPFYSESGGQVSDLGYIEGANFRANVIAMSKAPHGQHLHHLEIEYGTIKVGDVLMLHLDTAHRFKVKQHHSATHFLHRALNDVLGSEISQAGSYVGPDYLRFDFTHTGKISNSELKAIETIVNEYVQMAIPLKILELPYKEALKSGAKAFFSEKYGDVVRVVTFGDISLELCGGTHVSRSSEIGAFVIVSEGSIASGIRRIVAYSGITAYEYLKSKENLLEHASALLNVAEPTRFISAITTLEGRKKELEAEVSKFRHAELVRLSESLVGEKIQGVDLFVDVINEVSRGELSVIADLIRNRVKESIIILLTNDKKGTGLLVSVSKALSYKYPANTLLKLIAKTYDGSGGGKAEYASGSLKSLPTRKDIISLVQGSVNG